MDNQPSILAIAECTPSGEATRASLELVGAAAVLRDALGGAVTAVVAAPVGASAPRQMAEHGAGRVWHYPLAAGAEANAAVLEAAWAAVQQDSAAVVLLPDTMPGREVAARLAARMNGEVIGGCTVLEAKGGALHAGRPCLGGRALAWLTWTPSSPVVLSIATGAFDVLPATAVGAAAVEVQEPCTAAASTQIQSLGEIAPPPEAMDVTEAEVLVAGGGGVGGLNGFVRLTELARRLGGTVAASRVAVDRGWAPSRRQVGQTGKSVAPRVYLAFGISGAPQHIAGIRAADKVVAINRDPHAPIFAIADLAVVADLDEVVPALLQRLESPAAPAAARG